MVKILDRDEVEDTRNWQCRDGNDLSDGRLNDLCDSHEALRDLLRRVVNHRFYGGDIVFHYLEPGLRAEVDAALGVGG